MERTFVDLDHLVAERRAELVRPAPRPPRRPGQRRLRRGLAALCLRTASWLDARYVAAQQAAPAPRGRLETA
jgi:hypothetical protein